MISFSSRFPCLLKLKIFKTKIFSFSVYRHLVKIKILWQKISIPFNLISPISQSREKVRDMFRTFCAHPILLFSYFVSLSIFVNYAMHLKIKCLHFSKRIEDVSLLSLFLQGTFISLHVLIQLRSRRFLALCSFFPYSNVSLSNRVTIK